MDLLGKVDSHLKTMHFQDAALEIMDPNNLKCIQEDGMELIAKVCDIGLQSATKLDDISTCSVLLNYICRCYNPKLALVSTLEQVFQIKFICHD